MTSEARFAEKLSPYLVQLSKKSDAIRKMYTFDPVHEDVPIDKERDLLKEKSASPMFGVIRKYEGQILVLLAYTCASNCRYCERQDRVGVGLDSLGRLTAEQIDAVIEYVRNDPTIYEVIASGGDPLTAPIGLRRLFEGLATVESVRALRIHTRYPLQVPSKVDLDLMRALAKTKETIHLSLHVDHPDELTPETIALIKEFRKMGFILISQSVFLKGVNDDKETLKRMFLQLFELGVRPYYIYHCQEIPTTKHFVMRLEDEIALMTDLRKELSGLAFPQHAIDIPGARGKVLVPSNHWKSDRSQVTDFEGKTVRTSDWSVVTRPTS